MADVKQWVDRVEEEVTRQAPDTPVWEGRVAMGEYVGMADQAAGVATTHSREVVVETEDSVVTVALAKSVSRLAEVQTPGLVAKVDAGMNLWQ